MPVRSLLIWGVIALALVVLFTLLQGPSAERTAPELPYSELLARADAGRVAAVRTSGQAIFLTERDGRTFVVFAPEGTMADTVRRLYDAGVRIEAERPRAGPTLGDIMLGMLPMLLLIGAWFFFMRQMRAKGAGEPLPPAN
jgi:cell division protease FtsH